MFGLCEVAGGVEEVESGNGIVLPGVARRQRNGGVAPLVGFAFRNIILPVAKCESLTVYITGIMLLLTLLLQGCGHKGPLYLPQEPAAPQQSSQEK